LFLQGEYFGIKANDLQLGSVFLGLQAVSESGLFSHQHLQGSDVIG